MLNNDSSSRDALEDHRRLSVLLVMRDDFYPRLAAVAPQLLEAALPGLLNVPPVLSRHELHDIVTLPAREAGAHFAPGLPGLIVTDVLTTTPKVRPRARRRPPCSPWWRWR
ncbi:nSTAND1 domain-containing NTPase [Streptomyces sp. NPDC001076]